MKSGIRKEFVRSPFFYVGDKYKLLPQIQPLFPDNYERLVEPFVGGGSVFLNTESVDVVANDLNNNVIAIHNLLSNNIANIDKLIEKMIRIVRKYELTCSYEGDEIPTKLRREFPKTYFAQMNKEGFNRMKADYNKSSDKSALVLYVLMIYGFNRMLRFNKSGDYNIPVGNVDLNLNVVKALQSYADKSQFRNIQFTNQDFSEFFESQKLGKNDFVYVDPPYLITSSEYTKNWNEHSEIKLYKALDQLNSKGVRFALSNVELYNGENNEILEDWMKKYKVHLVQSNYINYFDNAKKSLKEVLVCNYE